MIDLAGDDIIIMAGSGIIENNICHIATNTGAKSFHVSLRQSYDSKMEFMRDNIKMGGTTDIPEFIIRYTSAKKR